MLKYLGGLLYIVGLYVFLLVILILAVHMLTKKKAPLYAVALILFAIILDLVLFNLAIYNKVILERTNIRFNENPSAYKFSEKRALNLISDDVFHNFRSSLYKKPVAISSYTVDEDFFHESSVARLYAILQDHSSKYPLYDELNTLSIKQFVKYGFLNFENLTVREKIFFSYVLEAVIEGFYIHKKLYDDYINISKVTSRLSDEVIVGGLFSSLKNEEKWRGNELENTILFLLDFPGDDSLNYRDYLIPSVEAKDKQNALSGWNFYSYIYNSVSATEYLSYLFEKNIMSEHSFVLLKDYYELINSNKKYKEFRGYNIPLNDNLLKVLGVTDPILKYYPSAEFASKNDIFSALNGKTSSKGKLYLESGWNKNGKNDLSQEGGRFSYHVLSYNPNMVGLKYNAEKEGYLYFSDCYDTYWNAYIDGKKIEIYKANVAFKAIKIPEGEHKVYFIYDPKFFRFSLWCYYFAFSICAIYLVIAGIRRKNSVKQ